MAELGDRPFPPGSYPAVVVGSGPGALQVSYWLSRYGIDHAVLSADQAPGADIVASRPLRTLVLAGPAVKGVLQDNPPLMYRMLQAQARRLRNANRWRS